MNISLNEYQATMVDIWDSNKSPDEELLYCCAKLVEEAGEAMGKVTRQMRGEEFDREGYLKELGDCLACLAVAAHSRGIRLDELGSVSIKEKYRHEGEELKRLILQNTILCQRVSDLTEKVVYLQATLLDLCIVFDSIKVCTLICKTTLEEVMQLNLKKLADRKARNGTLRGSGDNR